MIRSNRSSRAVISRTAITAARSLGNSYAPVLIAGNAMERAPGRLRQIEAAAVARRQQFVLALHTAFPDRIDCVHHVPGGQVVSADHPRVPGRAPSDPAALVEESRPRAAMNGPVPPAPPISVELPR